MTSNDRDEKTRRTREKFDRLFERLGPKFRASSPDFNREVEGCLAVGPVFAHNIAALISKGADSNMSLVLIQQGGATGGKAKAERYKHYEQVLVDLARPFAAKRNSGQINYRSVAHILKSRVIPKELKAVDEKTSQRIEALEHLSGLSEVRLYRIILNNKESVSASP